MVALAARLFIVCLVSVAHSFSISTIRSTTRISNERSEQRIMRPLFSVANPSNASNKKRSRSRKARSRTNSNQKSKSPQKWRFFGVKISPDDLDKDTPIDVVGPAVLRAVCKRLKMDAPDDNTLPPQLQQVKVIRRSLDARKKTGSPMYAYVLDVTVAAGTSIRWKPQSGRQELLTYEKKKEATMGLGNSNSDVESKEKPRVIIVGAGPAGLFCALTLARSGLVKPILLERGQAVESRGKDIGGLMHRSLLNTESNFCFGEGGAGTFSDGKLTTRIGRNSGAVRQVLETFVEFGAPSKILYDGAPHLGTDNLVRLMRNMRQALRDCGGEVLFGAKVEKLELGEESKKGVRVSYSPAVERSPAGAVTRNVEDEEELIWGDALVLATGHSARDFYESLHDAGVQLEAKGFAAGFRVEHPQKLINEIQYGSEWGPSVVTGKSVTDKANKEHFERLGGEADHTGRLPVPSYRLATDKAFDGSEHRGAYSFCMCPGGQIVPASTDPGEMVVNGMSFSKRDSLWANSALVVTIGPDDPVLDPYREEYGVLAGIAFQRDMEKRAYAMGGGNFTVPVQRLTDFVQGIPSESAPPSSYRLGVKPSACHEIYPELMTNALKDAIVNHFDKQLRGFLCEEGLLHAVETRTSSPVRIARDDETLQAIGIDGIFPAGEGAGFAGGIVSAAVDGIVVAEAILGDVIGNSDSQDLSVQAKPKSVGFNY